MGSAHTSIADIFNDYRVAIAGISASVLSLFLLRRWFAGGQLSSDARLDGATILITGANSGIGLETAKVLASRGANVTLACRSEQRGMEAVKEVTDACSGKGGSAQFMQLDLASLQSIREFSERFLSRNQQLNILINNAGIMAIPEAKTEDGFEMQFGVNHLGHFLLTNLLLPLLKQTPQARVVNVSSLAHNHGNIYWDNLNLEKEYTPFKAYCQSKLANVLFTKSLAHRMKDEDITTYSLHPGAVQTNLGRHLPKILVWLIAPFGWLMVKKPIEGAQTSLHCSLAPLSELVNGGYYSDCKLKKAAKQANSMEDAERLWKISEKLVGIASAD